MQPNVPPTIPPWPVRQALLIALQRRRQVITRQMDAVQVGGPIDWAAHRQSMRALMDGYDAYLVASVTDTPGAHGGSA